MNCEKKIIHVRWQTLGKTGLDQLMLPVSRVFPIGWRFFCHHSGGINDKGFDGKIKHFTMSISADANKDVVATIKYVSTGYCYDMTQFDST